MTYINYMSFNIEMDYINYMSFNIIYIINICHLNIKIWKYTKNIIYTNIKKI